MLNRFKLVKFFLIVEQLDCAIIKDTYPLTCVAYDIGLCLFIPAIGCCLKNKLHEGSPFCPRLILIGKQIFCLFQLTMG